MKNDTLMLSVFHSYSTSVAYISERPDILTNEPHFGKKGFSVITEMYYRKKVIK